MARKKKNSSVLGKTVITKLSEEGWRPVASSASGKSTVLEKEGNKPISVMNKGHLSEDAVKNIQKFTGLDFGQ